MQDPATDPQVSISPPRRNGRGLVIWLVVIVLALATAVVVAWQVPMLRSQMEETAGIAPRRIAALPAPTPAPAPSAGAMAAPPAQVPGPSGPAVTAAALDIRLALLEQRLTQLDLQAQAASGNAARAEALLVAYAARRTLDRGAPLGYLEDQLRLRFADAQPHAVAALIAAGQDPVTLDMLYGQLQALRPTLVGAPAEENSWDRVKRELSALFVIRRDTHPTTRPEDRLDQARVMLAAGKTAAAVQEVQRLPGASAARDWIAQAHRYEQVQSALDLIETTAMLEPRRLNDQAGQKVEQLSPLSGPAPARP